MNYAKTALLLAGLTALFMGVGYLIGGKGGMMIAFLVAVGMNLFNEYLFPFEAVSILLLIGVVGAIAIARPLKDDDGDADAAPATGATTASGGH